jgi:hypothetical protein
LSGIASKHLQLLMIKVASAREVASAFPLPKLVENEVRAFVSRYSKQPSKSEPALQGGEHESL